MKNKTKKELNGGYIAIISVLVILSVILTITMSISLLSIDGAQISLSNNQSNKALALVEGCVANALLFLSDNDALPSSVVLPEGSCSISADSHSGNNWVFSTQGAVDGFSKSIQVDVDRDSKLVINGWIEI